MHDETRKTYNQQYGYPPQDVQQTANKSMSTGVKVLLFIVVGSILSCALGAVLFMGLIGTAANEVANEQDAKTAGVKVVGCVTNEASNDIFPHVEVQVEVKNTTKNQQTFFLDLFVKDANQVRLGNTTDMVSDVRPGQQVKHTGTVPLSEPLKAGTKLTCSVDKVS